MVVHSVGVCPPKDQRVIHLVALNHLVAVIQTMAKIHTMAITCKGKRTTTLAGLHYGQEVETEIVWEMAGLALGQ